MKKITFILFALISGTTFAQNTHKVSDVTALASIVSPINISTDTSLNFGQIATGVAGNVVIAADGTRTGGANFIVASEKSAATFTVTGEKDLVYTVTYPSELTLKKDGTDETNTMLVNAFKISGNSDERTMPSTGSDAFGLGATIGVAADQTVGSYTGTFEVTVTYN